MVIYYSSKFKKEYKRLSSSVKKLAEKKELLFRDNPHNPALKSHQLTGRLKSYWSFSINYQYRIIFEFVRDGEVWFHSVGTHEIYK